MDSYYYNILDDIARAPDAWCYIIFGGRNTGKTYSCLRASKQQHIKSVYAKRTKEDVKLLCAGNNLKNGSSKIDISPFKSLNRDFKWNVRAFTIIDGLGGFYNCDDENKPVGDPIGYVIAMSVVGKFKGFDMSDCDWFIFDEFVPKIYDRVSRSEGEAVLDAYKTVSRDREHRGLPALKLICLANADNAASPLTNTLEVTDDIVQMSKEHESIRYLEDRGIFIHRLIDNKSFQDKEAESKIYKAMAGTQWGKMSLENEFGFNDFSNVNKIRLKNCRPVSKFLYMQKWYYVYVKEDGQVYLTLKQSNNKNIEVYDLTKENDQKAFYNDMVPWLKESTINNLCVYEKYSLYDLVINFTKYFKF